MKRYQEMSKAEKRELALQLRDLKTSEYWDLVGWLEFEIYERFKAQHVSNGYLYTMEGDKPVRKTPEQYALEQAGTRGAMDLMHALKTFRDNILEDLKKQKDKE